MKIAIVSQSQMEPKEPWQNHTELYTKDGTQVRDICSALKDFPYKFQIYKTLPEIKSEIESHSFHSDLVFPLLENCFSRNSNGLIPALWELYSIPYVGNDTYINILTSDKLRFKDFCTAIHIQTPPHILIRTASMDMAVRLVQDSCLKFPLVLKYRFGTMSYKIRKVNHIREFIQAASEMDFQANDLLCEEYIQGHEISVPIIGTSPHAHVLAVLDYFDSENKPLELYDSVWKGERDEEVKLVPLEKKHPYQKVIAEQSLRLYNYLGFRDYARMDFRLSYDGTPYLLEANSVPYFGYNSAFDPISYGYERTFGSVLDEILQSAYNRDKQ